MELPHTALTVGTLDSYVAVIAGYAGVMAHEQARKGARIRRGGPGEELALAEHLASLAPTPQRLAEAGALAEALVCGTTRGCLLLQPQTERSCTAASLTLDQYTVGQHHGVADAGHSTT